MKEHIHCREKSSPFDVSHIGQLRIHGKDRHEFIERITVIDMKALNNGESSLSLITNEKGGIKDDIVITKNTDHIYMIVNAACKDKDLEHMNNIIKTEFKSKDVRLEILDENTLLAVQWPQLLIVLEMLFEHSLKDQIFMTSTIRNIP